MDERGSLTECEKIVMKSVWDAGRDVSLVEIMAGIGEKYGKEWKRQTVSTFLLHLIQKGFLTSYRVGRVFYYHEEISQDDYKLQITADFVNFWFDNSREEWERVVSKLDLQG